MAKAPKRYVDARTEEILNAARRCFASNGYRGTAMADIASDAGLSVGALYRYFANKIALFHALTRHAAEHNKSLVARSEDEPPGAQLKRFVSSYLEMAANPACQTDLALDLRLQAEALDSKIVKQEVGKAFSAQLAYIVGLLQAAKGSHGNDQTDDAQGRILIAALRGAGQQVLENPDFPIAPYGETIIATIDHWIAGASERQRA